MAAMNAGQPDGRLARTVADPTALVLWQVRAALMAAALASVAGVISALGFGTGGIAEAARDLWLLGTVGPVAWTAGLFVTYWSRRSALPQRLGVLLEGIALVGGGLLLAVGHAFGMEFLAFSGWLAEAIAGALGIFLLWPHAEGPRVASEHLEDLLAPGFRPGVEEIGTDRLARGMVMMAAVDLLLAALFALRHEEHFLLPTFAGLLFWYGWVGSLAWASLHYFGPRFLGRHLTWMPLSVGGFIGWQGGILGAFAFGEWWILALSAVGGLAMLPAFLRLFVVTMRPRPRIVGSRRAFIHSSFRSLLVLSATLALVAIIAIPWPGPVSDGTYRLVTAWAVASLLALLGHMAFVHLGWHYAPQSLVAGIDSWVVGLVFSLWTGGLAVLGAGLTLAGVVVTMVAFERHRPQRQMFTVLKGKTGT